MATGVVGAVGVATLTQVRHRDEAIVGALPILFAAHQLVEAFVWLGLRGEISAGVGAAATRVYLLYAQGILPSLVPLGLLLLEPDRFRRRWLWPFVALGIATSLRLLWVVGRYPVSAKVHRHGLEYVTHSSLGLVVGAAYVIATCGPALFSTRRYLREFGVANLLGVLAVGALKSSDFTSVWCVYAALVSVLILVHFRRQRARHAPGSPAVATA